MPDRVPIDVTALETEICARLRDLPSLTVPTVRTLRREFSTRLTGADARRIVELANRLVARSPSAPRFLAYELIRHHRQALASLGERQLRELGRGIDNWGDVDSFAIYLAGPAWRERHVNDRLIHSWARSRDRWWRRAALVSTVPLNLRAQGGSGDTARTLGICRLLLDDRDDMVVKAMSWALRELAKGDPRSVRAFLTEHQGRLAKRVVREVRNKLSTGLKNPLKPNHKSKGKR